MLLRGDGAERLARRALTSGSFSFTLGFAGTGGMGSTFLVPAEAAIGPALLAVLIAHLPTTYSAFPVAR
jgi:hypothetical protein